MPAAAATLMPLMRCHAHMPRGKRARAYDDGFIMLFTPCWRHCVDDAAYFIFAGCMLILRYLFTLRYADADASRHYAMPLPFRRRCRCCLLPFFRH